MPRDPGPPRSPRVRPDPRPSRLVVGAGALAALSVMASGLVRVPDADAEAMAPPASRGVAALTTPARVERPVRYVRLGRGEEAPPGATVIRAADPTPRVVRVARPAQPRSANRPAARTRQSGR